MGKKKTAVILIHGIGEQIPMATIRSFVDAVWTTDPDLVDRGKPDPNTGKARVANAAWSKPDERNRSFELQLITTETGKNGKRIDFFEYYWAHRVTGTTWEQVRDWLFGLMLRNPLTRVPTGLRPAWLLMWVIASIITALWLYTLFLALQERSSSLAMAIGSALVTALASIVVKVMVSHVGDIVRYVSAQPQNLAVRQSIRENGVRLLEDLMGIDGEGRHGEATYDRIIVVGHSLGTIVGYDILTHAFGRLNSRTAVSADLQGPLSQPKRAEMEELIRASLQAGGPTWDIDGYRILQSACLKELNAIGNPWIVTDFVTLGSPLTHAEFLMERDRDALIAAQRQRILPSCPPTLEYDATTKKQHFSYRSPAVAGFGSNRDLAAPRVPHHAALFAYTRWTNIFSPQRKILAGDIVSGPLARAMGLNGVEGLAPLSGILDVQVLPSKGGEAPDRKRRLFTHLLYWDRTVARCRNDDIEPMHIQELRKALNLSE